MRSYEAACIFRPEEQRYLAGKEAVKAALSELGASITKEEDMGVRTLAYEIADQIQGHYFVFYFDMEPANAHQIEDSVRYLEDLLRILVVRPDK